MAINTNIQAQNDYMRQMQSSLGNYGQGQYIQKADRILQLSTQIATLTRELENLTLDEPLEAPTQRMLNSNEALKNAYSEMLVIWKLAGKPNV